MKKECNVVMLPTENQSKIVLKRGNVLEYAEHPPLYGIKNLGWKYQHLYITSPDEEIKEGDWMYHKLDGKIFKYEPSKYHQLEDILQNPKEYGYKKIIATTDESIKQTSKNSILITHPFPRPSNEFLKKYCELGGIDKVMVEYENEIALDGHTIIGSGLKVAPDNTITITKV